MIKRISTISLMLILVLGFSSSSLVSGAFAENYLDISNNNINSIYADQTASDERDKIEAEKLAAERDKIEAEKLAAERDKIEAEKLAAERDRIEAEKRAAERDRIEAEKLAAERDRIEEERRDAVKDRIEAEKRAAERDRIEEERRDAVKDRIEAEKRTAERDRIEEERRDAVKDRIEEEHPDAVKDRIEEEHRDAVKDRIDTIRSTELDSIHYPDEKCWKTDSGKIRCEGHDGICWRTDEGIRCQVKHDFDRMSDVAKDRMSDVAKDRLADYRADKDRLAEHREAAKDRLAEHREAAKDRLADYRADKDRLAEHRDAAKVTHEEKRMELKGQAKEQRDQRHDNAQDRKEAIKDRVKEQRDQRHDNTQDSKEGNRSNVLDRHSDLKEKYQNKKDEIKTDLKEKAKEKHTDVKKRIHEKRIDIKEKIQNKKDNVREFRDSVTDRAHDKVTDRVTLEKREKIRDTINDKVKDRVHQEIREKIKGEIRDRVEYRVDLIQSKINEMGKDKFREIVLEHKQQIREDAKERIDIIRDKIRSPALIDQVEDGTYYGNIVELQEDDITNYVLSFQGDVFSTNENNVKSVSGDVNLELVRLSDVTATLRIIGGQIVIEDAETGELHNVHDVAFGRSRANFDSNTLQVAINTIDVDGQPHTFVMQINMDGVFPIGYGEIIDISATDGKSKSGTEWILDFVGTLAVDDPVPITVFEDVEELSQVDDIVEKSISDCFDLTLSDFYTDTELEGLTDDDLVDLEEELLIDICSEIADEVEEEMIAWGDKMKVISFKTFIALIVTLTLIPIASVYADSGLINVLDYDVGYDIENGEMLAIDLDIDFTTLSVEIVSYDDGFVEMTVPRGLIDSKYSDTEDDIFYVIIDGTESYYLEVDSSETDRTLIIPFFADDQQIEILGTNVLSSLPVVPESFAETVDDKEIVDDIQAVSDIEGGGCLIATAAYGTELAPQVQLLREIRDNTVMSTVSGSAFMTGFNQLYYSFSPTIADMERENPMFQEVVRAFITPMVSTLSIMTLAEDGSEVEVLGLGISVIALNLGMYIATPAIVVWQVRKRIWIQQMHLILSPKR